MVLKPDHDAVVKLLMIGDCGTGKTSLRMRFASDTFDPNVEQTIGIDFEIRKMMIGDKVVKVHVWDTSGQPRFRNIINEHFHEDLSGVLLVYDLTNKTSFESIRSWMEQTQKHAPEHVIKVLVGNKVELAEKSRAVSYDRGKALADEYGIQFFETSAATNIHVEEVFTTITKESIARLANQEEKHDIPTSPRSPAGCLRGRFCFCF